jgi:hypothetical protein
VGSRHLVGNLAHGYALYPPALSTREHDFFFKKSPGVSKKSTIVRPFLPGAYYLYNVSRQEFLWLRVNFQSPLRK